MNTVRNLIFASFCLLLQTISMAAQDSTQIIDRGFNAVDYYHGKGLTCGIAPNDLMTFRSCRNVGRAIGLLAKLDGQFAQLKIALLEERDALSSLAAAHNITKEEMNEARREIEDAIAIHDFAVTIHDAFMIVAEGGSLARIVKRGRRIQELQRLHPGRTADDQAELRRLLEREMDLSVTDAEISAAEQLVDLLTKGGAQASTAGQIAETYMNKGKISEPEILDYGLVADLSVTATDLKDLARGLKSRSLGKVGGPLILAQIADRALVHLAKEEKRKWLERRASWIAAAAREQELIDNEIRQLQIVNANIQLIDKIVARSASAQNRLRGCMANLCEPGLMQSFYVPAAPEGSFGIRMPIIIQRIDATLRELNRLSPGAELKPRNDDPDAPHPDIVQRCEELEEELSDLSVQEEYFRSLYNDVNRRILASGGAFSREDAELKQSYRAQITAAESKRGELEAEFEDKNCPDGRPRRPEEIEEGEEPPQEDDSQDVILDFRNCYTGDPLVIAATSGIDPDKVGSALDGMRRGVAPSGPEAGDIMAAIQEMSPLNDHACPEMQNGHTMSGGEMCQVWASIVDEPPASTVRTWPTGSRGCAFPRGGPVIPIAPVVCQYIAVQHLGMDQSKIASLARWNAHSFDTICYFVESADIRKQLEEAESR